MLMSEFMCVEKLPLTVGLFGAYNCYNRTREKDYLFAFE